MRKLLLILLFNIFLVSSVYAGIFSQKKYTRKLPYHLGSKIPVIVTKKQLKWKVHTNGVKTVNLVGSPDQPGFFMLRITLPAGFKVAPRYHTTDVYITILSGQIYRRFGKSVHSKGIFQGPGSFTVIPSGTIHSEWVPKSEEVTAQIYGMGPWKTIFVDAKGNPIPKPKPASQ